MENNQNCWGARSKKFHEMKFREMLAVQVTSDGDAGSTSVGVGGLKMLRFGDKTAGGARERDPQ